jgi:hypothetical protein
VAKKVDPEIVRLRKLEHDLWHLLDDSEEQDRAPTPQETTLVVDRTLLRKIARQLPEECPQYLRAEARREPRDEQEAQP